MPDYKVQLYIALTEDLNNYYVFGGGELLYTSSKKVFDAYLQEFRDVLAPDVPKFSVYPITIELSEILAKAKNVMSNNELQQEM